MVLEGAFASAATGACSTFSALNNMERNDVFARFGVTGAENRAHQDFKRRLAAISYKVERQKLHREDIKDLVQLTTARMGIYHLVGMLLLDFCMHWYTKNELLELDFLPTWFLELFLISNFGAIAYLVLSVWMAMYAGIASRAIGTRLLTSFTRLSLPKRQELDTIKMPLFLSLENAKNRLLGRTVHESDTFAAPTADAAMAGGGLATAGAGCSDMDARERQEADDEQHFRRFLQELPQWLSYDTCSRVCMSFGMNQMLQALSYYVVIVVWAKSPMAALTSFFGVKLLSLIVFWLDVGDSHEGCREVSALIVLHFAPPILGSTLLFFEIDPWLPNFGRTGHKWAGFILTSLVFVGHAGWLLYMSTITEKAGTASSRFRPGDFASVLEWVRNVPVRRDHIEAVMAAHQELSREMKKVVDGEEADGGVASVEARQSSRLADLRAQVVVACEAVDIGEPHHARDTELSSAQDALRRYEVWAEAPELLAALLSLRHPCVQSRLSKQDNALVDEAFQRFLRVCQQQSLGLWRDSQVSPSIPRWRDGERPLAARPLAFGEQCVVRVERPLYGGSPIWVHPRGFDDEAADVSPSPPSVGGGTASESREVSLRELLQDELPRWRTSAMSLRSKTVAACGARVSDAKRASTNGGAVPGQWFVASGKELKRPPDDLPVRLVNYLTMGMVVWWCAAASLRVVYVTWNDYDTEGSAVKPHSANQTFLVGEDHRRAISVDWPEPAHLFKVDALFCHGTNSWISDGYSLFAQQTSLPLLLANINMTASPVIGAVASTATSVAQTSFGDTRTHYDAHLTRAWEGPAGGVICGGELCDVLQSPSGDGEAWQLAAFNQATVGHSPTPLAFPPAWRRVVGEWTGASGGDQSEDAGVVVGPNAPANIAQLAAWDGTTVYVASLRMNNSSAFESSGKAASLAPRVNSGGGTSGNSFLDYARGNELASVTNMHVHVRFALKPANGLCPRGEAACKMAMSNEHLLYNDVRALQFLRGGRALLVLLAGGVVDFWDLERGIIRQRLHVGRNYSSMCQTGRFLLFAEHPTPGQDPSLVVVPLPRDLADLMHHGEEANPWAISGREQATKTTQKMVSQPGPAVEAATPPSPAMEWRSRRLRASTLASESNREKILEPSSMQRRVSGSSVL
eukprot:TRINITY_DN54708_c0_g1_i1.p1 TRINITY_DN54708_c0_g1~~TRINITY_DN54708_c0_g1_i1.p1  ORF type:complete len:1144 (+),score=150.48 TRINITY_DN54708_c0_g1_i1:76-3507(+)